MNLRFLLVLSLLGAPALAAPLSRVDFNRRAAEENLPLLWRSDANGNGQLDPGELVVLWGVSREPATTWIAADGQLTQKAKDAIAALSTPPKKVADAKEQRRRELVRQELSQGKPTLMDSGFVPASPQDKAVLEHLVNVSYAVERLYARQKGTLGLDAKIPADDPASRTLFYRNQSPSCVQPATEKIPECSALPEPVKPVFELYPPELQTDPEFCEALPKEKNWAKLQGHFTALRRAKDGSLEAVPYSVAFKEDTEAVAKELDAAAAAVTDKKEAAFKKYLTAAAKAFRNNDWEAADEAWAAMNAQNSAWYLRVAPDESYYEPCAIKAGFGLTLARINPDSVIWQKKLSPVKADMEKALATFAGPPYKARNVKFQLPDFIDVVVNAGDARFPTSGVAGQSLPNWGRVAARGGRTVAMVNIFSDADSKESLAQQVQAAFCPDVAKEIPLEAAPQIMSTVLHEAAHNLGPSHDYKVNGKVAEAVFGGPLASTMEELKAQTAALYFDDWLVDRKVLTPAESKAAHLRELVWMVSQISRGLYDASGVPKTYGHVGAIQLGALLADGAVVWNAQAKAANGKDVGCLDVKLDAWRPSVEKLAKIVLAAKSKGDKAAAEKLKTDYVDTADTGMRAALVERWARAPRASFVYSIPR